MSAFILSTVFTFESDLAPLETSETFTFSTAPRTNKAGEKNGEGIRFVIPKPTFLTAPSTLSPALKRIYLYGAEESLKNYFRKALKDNTIKLGHPVPEVTEALILEMLESTGGRLLTKDSIATEVENNIAETLIARLIQKGIPESKLSIAVEGITKILSSLAAPNTQLDESTKEKLTDLLNECTQTPVVSALLARLAKPKEDTIDMAEFL